MTETRYLPLVLKKYAQSMEGRVAAITGATSGTGYVCARELARLGAKVRLLNRPSARAEEALAKLQTEVPEAEFQQVDCDLQNFQSVRDAAATLRAKDEVLDLLVNNAGVMALPDRATSDGYDVQMQTNAISHFLLTKELFPLLAKSRDARVVNHTSMARLGGPHEGKYFEARGGDLGGDGSEEENNAFEGPRWERYHQSKLANCTFAYGLIERLEADGIKNVKVLLAHPGLSRTNLQQTTTASGGIDVTGGLMESAQSAEDGAAGIIRCCVDPEVKSGEFYGPKEWTGFPENLEPEALLMDAENTRICWSGCEKAVGAFRVSP